MPDEFDEELENQDKGQEEEFTPAKTALQELESAEFDSELKEVHFTIAGEGYFIRELLARERDAFLQEQNKRFEIKGKSVEVKNFLGIQSDLLKRCLYRDGETKALATEVIQKLKASTVQKIYEAAQELNGLTRESAEDKEDEAKND